MRKEKVEDRLHTLAAVVGTEYKPYVTWLKADFKNIFKYTLNRYKTELRARVYLRKHQKEYGRAEELFYGQQLGYRDLGKYK